MANKTYNTRIKNKRDTSANWESKNPVLLNGEIAIVDTASGETRFKIGDGTKKYTQLPFQDEIMRNSKADLSIVDTLLPKSGGTMTGSVTMNGVALTENEDYGDTFPETASPGKIFFKNETENPALLKTGGVMTGSITTNGIILTKGVDYDDTLPTTVIPGKLFFKKVT